RLCTRGLAELIRWPDICARYGHRIDVKDSGHHTLRRSEESRRRARAWSSGTLTGAAYGVGVGQPSARHLSAAKPWIFDGCVCRGRSNVLPSSTQRTIVCCGSVKTYLLIG